MFKLNHLNGSSLSALSEGRKEKYELAVEKWKAEILNEIELASKEQLASWRAFNNVYSAECKNHEKRKLFDAYYKTAVGQSARTTTH